MLKQRRLDPEVKEEAAKMLQLKANKRMVQTHLISLTGKAVTMKDVHNVAEKSKPELKNDFQELVAEMKKVQGM